MTSEDTRQVDEVRILVRLNGPYRIYGPAKVLDVDGNEFELPPGEWVSLCRCGHSETKPLCDGTHKRIGFQAETRVAPAAAPPDA